MATAWTILLALAPSLGVGFLFYKIMKAIIEGDRNERLAQARWEAGRPQADGTKDTRNDAHVPAARRSHNADGDARPHR